MDPEIASCESNHRSLELLNADKKALARMLLYAGEEAEIMNAPITAKLIRASLDSLGLEVKIDVSKLFTDSNAH